MGVTTARYFHNKVTQQSVSDLVVSLLDVLLGRSARDTQDSIEVRLVCTPAAGVKRATGGAIEASHAYRQTDPRRIV